MLIRKTAILLLAVGLMGSTVTAATVTYKNYPVNKSSGTTLSTNNANTP